MQTLDISANLFCTSLRALQHASAKKDIRYYLNGILLEIQGGQLHMVATDGHVMAHILISGENSNTPNWVDIPDTQWIISGDEIAELLRSFDPGKKSIVCDRELFIDIDGEELVFRDVAGKRSYKPDLVDGKYPDWRRVVPKRNRDTPKSNEDMPAFNVELLAIASKVFTACMPPVCKAYGVRSNVGTEHDSMVLYNDWSRTYDQRNRLTQEDDPVRYNDDVLFPDKVRINLEYYRRCSLALDLRIVLITAGLLKSSPDDFWMN